jgi:hypothetical protein
MRGRLTLLYAVFCRFLETIKNNNQFLFLKIRPIRKKIQKFYLIDSDWRLQFLQEYILEEQQ